MVFPLPLPPPVDLEFGRKVLQESPQLLQGNVLLNIVGWVKDRISYRLDEGEGNEWVPPSQVLAEGSGDCEDVALVWMSVAQAAGFSPRLAFYWSPKSDTGHTVAWVSVPAASGCDCQPEVMVVEAREGGGVMAWQTPSLNHPELLATFEYKRVEIL